jgi:F-type H+-transporting ATPase subunit delta
VQRAGAAVAPYVKALFSLAKERGQTEVVGRELHAVTQVFRRETELRDLLARPWVSHQVKRNVTSEIVSRLDVSKLTRDFVALLAGHGRGDQLEAVAARYEQLVDRELGRARARVRTAVPLSESERRELAARLGQALQSKQVVIDEVVDRQLLGGFVAEIDSLLLDGSLDGQLARMRDRFVRG